jgi:hypothetical protein
MNASPKRSGATAKSDSVGRVRIRHGVPQRRADSLPDNPEEQEVGRRQVDGLRQVLVRHFQPALNAEGAGEIVRGAPPDFIGDGELESLGTTAALAGLVLGVEGQPESPEKSPWQSDRSSDARHPLRFGVLSRAFTAATLFGLNLSR